MSNPRSSNDANKQQVDQLLAGLTRLTTKPPHKSNPEIHLPSSLTPSSQNLPSTAPPSRSTAPIQIKTKTTTTIINRQEKNQTHDNLPISRSRSITRIQPLISISRLDILETIEEAIGLHTRTGSTSISNPISGDLKRIDKLITWIHAAAVTPADVLHSIVSSTRLTDPLLTTRVLTIIHYLITNGGPIIIPDTVQISSDSQGLSPATRVCVDVLTGLGHDTVASKELLYNDEYVRRMVIATGNKKREIPEEALPVCKTLPMVAVEAYAVALGRKFVFHGRYEDTETNYSLDRFFRRIRIEGVDHGKEEENQQMYSRNISKAAAEEVSLLVHIFCVAASRVLGIAPGTQAFILTLAEACNAYAFFGYLLKKTGLSKMDHLDLEKDRDWLAMKVGLVKERGTEDWETLKKYVDEGVLNVILNTTGRPVRPESRHRREIVCEFSSFRAMHNALRPDGIRERGRSEIQHRVSDGVSVGYL